MSTVRSADTLAAANERASRANDWPDAPPDCEDPVERMPILTQASP